MTVCVAPHGYIDGCAALDRAGLRSCRVLGIVRCTVAAMIVEVESDMMVASVVRWGWQLVLVTMAVMAPDAFGATAAGEEALSAGPGTTAQPHTAAGEERAVQYDAFDARAKLFPEDEVEDPVGSVIDVDNNVERPVHNAHSYHLFEVFLDDFLRLILSVVDDRGWHAVFVEVGVINFPNLTGQCE